MKTLEIKGILKKDILIVELPRKSDVEIFPNSVEIYNQFTGQEESIKGFYTLLGSPDEIREEDVKALVEKTFTFYKDYNSTNRQFNFALGSFNSALESEIYWNVNPYPYPSPYDPRSKTGRFEHGEELEKVEKNYNEAESRTFDRNRTLIFVKN